MTSCTAQNQNVRPSFNINLISVHLLSINDREQLIFLIFFKCDVAGVIVRFTFANFRFDKYLTCQAQKKHILQFSVLKS